MPAIDHSFVDPTPKELYVDTDILVSYLVRSEPHHARCRFLLIHAAEGGTRLAISSLTWLEFVNVVTRENFRSRLPAKMKAGVEGRRWNSSRVRRDYIRFFLTALDDLLGQFDWSEITLTPAVRTLAIQFVIDYNLRPLDAAHLASVRSAGIMHIASLDESYRRVDDLHVWNDQIHGGRGAV